MVLGTSRCFESADPLSCPVEQCSLESGMQFALPFGVVSSEQTNVNVAAWVVRGFAVEAIAAILTVKVVRVFRGECWPESWSAQTFPTRRSLQSPNFRRNSSNAFVSALEFREVVPGCPGTVSQPELKDVCPTGLHP
jgi:hypothetical protein